jgi:hypothetical protein
MSTAPRTSIGAAARLADRLVEFSNAVRGRRLLPSLREAAGRGRGVSPRALLLAARLRRRAPASWKASVINSGRYPARTVRVVRAEVIAISRSAITANNGIRNSVYSGMPGIRLPKLTMN